MQHTSCLLNARVGDEVELFIPASRYVSDCSVKCPVVGFYDLQSGQSGIPILGILPPPPPHLQSYYYASDVLKGSKAFPFEHCIPMHDYFLEYAVIKIYKKSFLDAKKLAEDKYLAEYDV